VGPNADYPVANLTTNYEIDIPNYQLVQPTIIDEESEDTTLDPIVPADIIFNVDYTTNNPFTGIFRYSTQFYGIIRDNLPMEGILNFLPGSKYTLFMGTFHDGQPFRGRLTYNTHVNKKTSVKPEKNADGYFEKGILKSGIMNYNDGDSYTGSFYEDGSYETGILTRKDKSIINYVDGKEVPAATGGKRRRKTKLRKQKKSRKRRSKTRKQ